MHLCFLLISIGISQAAELVQPNPPSCELVVNNFAETRSETHNSLGFEMKQAGGMQTSLIADDDDPHLLLTPDVSNPSSSFWYSFLRKPGQCFDASNFDFLSLELKGGPGDKILIGFSTNPIHCDESAESVIRYSMLYITKSSENDSKRQIDIPFSKLAGDATKSNFGAVVLGGLTRPLELYSVKLKGMCATGITNETLISDRYQNMTDSDSETDSEDKKDCILVVDDFANEESKENALRGTHGADDSMSVETYSADHGLLLTSANVSSYWYTVIPCMKFKHYDMLVLDIAGPFGGDFELEIKTKVGCDTKFKDFKFMASSFLDGTLTGEQQQLIIPFDKLEDFDNTIHTIGSIIVGGFLNEDRSSPMTLNIKSITFRRENCTDDDGTEEHIQAKEKGGHPVQKEETDATHSYSSSSRCTLSAAALVLMTFLFTL